LSHFQPALSDQGPAEVVAPSVMFQGLGLMLLQLTAVTHGGMVKTHSGGLLRGACRALLALAPHPRMRRASGRVCVPLARRRPHTGLLAGRQCPVLKDRV